MLVQVLSARECAEQKMGCFLAVSAAAGNEPKFIHLRYSPKGAPANHWTRPDVREQMVHTRLQKRPLERSSMLFPHREAGRTC